VKADNRSPMRADSTSLFAWAIYEHLELKRRNAALELEMPLAKYMPWRPSENGEGVESGVGREDEDTVANVLWPEPSDLS
jgi:hypothetical protein